MTDTGNHADEATVFRALGHPIRLGIVLRLARDGEICACDFTEEFGVSQPTVSGHLRALRDASLVHTRKQGTQICYSLNTAKVREVEVLLARITSALPDLAGA